MTAIPPAPALHGPLQIELQFTLALPPDRVFDLVANRLPEWVTGIHAVTWDHQASTAGSGLAGACSERSCDFGGKQLREVMVAWEPGRRYTYRADLARSTLKLPLHDHLGSFELTPAAGGTRVTWRQYFRPAWFVPAAMLRWQMRDRLMKPAVERLLEAWGGAWT